MAVIYFAFIEKKLLQILPFAMQIKEFLTSLVNHVFNNL